MTLDQQDLLQEQGRSVIVILQKIYFIEIHTAISLMVDSLYLEPIIQPLCARSIGFEKSMLFWVDHFSVA